MGRLAQRRATSGLERDKKSVPVGGVEGSAGSLAALSLYGGMCLKLQDWVGF